MVSDYITRALSLDRPLNYSQRPANLVKRLRYRLWLYKHAEHGNEIVIVILGRFRHEKLRLLRSVFRVPATVFIIFIHLYVQV